MRAFPEEFRRDVVKVARNSKESRNNITADYGVSPATLSNWIRQADIEDGVRDGVTKEQAEDLRCQWPIQTAHGRPAEMPTSGQFDMAVNRPWLTGASRRCRPGG